MKKQPKQPKTPLAEIPTGALGKIGGGAFPDEQLIKLPHEEMRK